MQVSEVSRAVTAAMSIASALGLAVNDAVVLQNSNKLAVRLLPCDVLARVAPMAQQVAELEVEIAQRLSETESPVAALEPRAEPRAYERDGFVVTLWTYYEPVTLGEVSPTGYANALERLHAGMRKLDVATPHFTDRVTEAQQLVARRDQTPALAEADRELLSSTLRDLRRTIADRGVAEQLLHAANANYFFTDPAMGKPVPKEEDPKRSDFKTKADVVAFVKKAFADGAAAIKAKGDKGMSDLLVDPFAHQQVRVLDMAYGLIEHSGEHYGQLVGYYRTAGLVPPESRPKK